MAGEFEEGDVFFAHVVENSDRADLRAGEPDDFAARAAELALQRLHAIGGRVKMLLKKCFENFHEDVSGDYCLHKDNTGGAAELCTSSAP